MQADKICLFDAEPRIISDPCLQGFLNFSMVAFVICVSGNPCCPALVIGGHRHLLLLVGRPLLSSNAHPFSTSSSDISLPCLFVAQKNKLIAHFKVVF